MPDTIQQDVLSVLEQISTRRDADIILYVGQIIPKNADLIIEKVNSLPSRHNNVVLILTTYGGSPDAAYRIARFLKKKYNEFILFVFGYCKSAGTLIAVGADQIVMSEYGEFGPLDMQVAKEDEMINASSLNYLQVLVSLKGYALEFFDEFFISLKRKSKYLITTKTASDIAVSLVTGILAPIAEQIDPLRLAEVQRALTLAVEYGNRLNSKNDKEILTKLASTYSSHGFAIDFEEAKNLFAYVSEPDDAEKKLAALLHARIREPSSEVLDIMFSKKMNQRRGIRSQNKRKNKHDSVAVKSDHADNKKIEQVVFPTIIPTPVLPSKPIATATAVEHN
jgi:hypothetical protein